MATGHIDITCKARYSGSWFFSLLFRRLRWKGYLSQGFQASMDNIFLLKQTKSLVVRLDF